MPRTLPAIVIDELNSVSSGEVFLFLIEIDYGTGTHRLVNNNEDVIHNGNVFTAYPFQIVLAPEDGETLPTVQVSFDNVDRLLIDAVRSATTAPVVELKLVLASAPNVAEMVIPDLALRNVSYTANKLTGTLYVGDIMNQKFPADYVTPQQYGGLF